MGTFNVSEETVKKYIETKEADFLAGKTDEKIKKYNEKTLEKKYTILTGWVARNNKNAATPQATPESTLDTSKATPVDLLFKTAKKVLNKNKFTLLEIETIDSLLSDLKFKIDKHREEAEKTAKVDRIEKLKEIMVAKTAAKVKAAEEAAKAELELKQLELEVTKAEAKDAAAIAEAAKEKAAAAVDVAEAKLKQLEEEGGTPEEKEEAKAKVEKAIETVIEAAEEATKAATAVDVAEAELKQLGEAKAATAVDVADAELKQLEEAKADAELKE